MTALPHPSAEQISDLLAGAVPATEAMELNAHLASCAACQQTRDDLLDVIAVLADEGAVAVAMPDDVAASLDATLRRASIERTARDAMPEPVRPLPADHSGERRPWRWLAGAAAAVAVVSLGVAGLKALPTQGGDSTDGASSGLSPGRGTDPAAGGYASAPPGLKQGDVQFQSGALDSVNAAQVPAQARRLASAQDMTSEFRPSFAGCAEPILGGPSIAIRYHGERAVLSIDRATRVVTVYDCATATEPLLVSDY